MTESFSVDNLRAFVEAWKKGELTPKIKEEPDYSADSHVSKSPACRPLGVLLRSSWRRA